MSKAKGMPNSLSFVCLVRLLFIGCVLVNTWVIFRLVCYCASKSSTDKTYRTDIATKRESMMDLKKQINTDKEVYQSGNRPRQIPSQIHV